MGRVKLVMGVVLLIDKLQIPVPIIMPQGSYLCVPSYWSKRVTQSSPTSCLYCKQSANVQCGQVPSSFFTQIKSHEL